MAVQQGDHNKIEYINLLMSSLHDSTDCIYESLMDEDDVALKDALHHIHSLLEKIKKNHLNDKKAS